MISEGDRDMRAARYLRMSTEHQRYSTENQAIRIDAYALERGYQIAKTYADEGVSGLGIQKRRGLQALLRDVVSGRADFDIVLVYDVSRWGRFQNPDQSAHYEFLCREAGVPVEYCAEPFANDDSLTSTLMKAVKRLMAAEYSRELSAKVRDAQRNLILKGYWQHGPPGFGLRRLVVGHDGRPRGVLEAGQRKSVREDHVVLVPGPAAEVATIHRIFRHFVGERISPASIARLLNAEGVPAESGATWTRARIHTVLTNRKYLGDLRYNLSRGTLDGRRVVLNRELWLHRPNAHAPIVEREQFDRAQEVCRARKARATKVELRRALRRLFLEHGALTTRIIDATPGIPCSRTISRRFGGLTAAYEAAGFHGRRRPTPAAGLTDAAMLAHLRDLLATHGRLARWMIDQTPGMPSATSYYRRFGTLANAYRRVGYVMPAGGRRLQPRGATAQIGVGDEP